MAITKSTHTNKLSLNVQHDYITLRTPNGNFTVNRYGTKATVMDKESFGRLNEFVNSRPDLSYTQIMEMLLDPNVLSGLYPNWDEEKRSFKAGDTVDFTNPLVTKDFGTKGTIIKSTKSNAVVKFQNGKMVKIPISMIG